MEVIQNNNEFEYVVAIGASTGGKDTVCKLLKNIPKNFSPIVVAQHMPPEYISSYVRHLKKFTGHDVIESKDGDELCRGRIIIATADHQMRLMRSGDRLYLSCVEEGPYKGDCPSIDILFESVARVMGDKGIGVLLTGNGVDGVKGLLEMKRSNGFTICQDQSSSVVYNLPRAAFEEGAAAKQLNLKNIPDEIINRICKNEYNLHKKYIFYKGVPKGRYAEYI
ncbi:MAG: chemotaxis protein CheB [Clostridiales bacterium]|jgi:two-component system chemotaxis response regulator CheB|nr:chemotaxis protein CheB [Clostridiales bacterium]